MTGRIEDECHALSCSGHGHIEVGGGPIRKGRPLPYELFDVSGRPDEHMIGLHALGDSEVDKLVRFVLC